MFWFIGLICLFLYMNMKAKRNAKYLKAFTYVFWYVQYNGEYSVSELQKMIDWNWKNDGDYRSSNLIRANQYRLAGNDKSETIQKALDLGFKL